jgi:hypothetical protein
VPLSLPSPRELRKKSRRTNAGRRRWPETDAPKPMSEDDFTKCIRIAEELSSNLFQQGNAANAKLVVADLRRLVGEVQRLRNLIKRVQPFTLGRHAAAMDREDEKELRQQLEEELKREADQA